ncbi:MAG: type VI secretion system-associated FHA domain protein TagH [Pseudorhodobacter sp.]
MPVTLRFQSTGAVPGDGAPIVMRGPSLTIGRGPENDVVLPDPDRLISKNHCTIEDQDGDVTVIDFSTNGTFLNYGKVPLGQVPTPLNDGDVLSMGAYELIVAILPAAGRSNDPLSNLPPPIDDGPVSHGIAGAAPENLLDLLEDPGSQKSDFLDDLMGGQAPRGPSQIVREDPIDSLMLPQVGDEVDPILGHIPDPLDEDFGPTQSAHGASVHDGFTAQKKADAVIPDDWDDDFLNPNPAPVAKPTPARPPAPPPAAAVPPLPEPVAHQVAPPAPQPTPPTEEEEQSPFAAPVAANRLASSVVPPPPPLQRSVPLKATAPKPVPPASAPASAAEAPVALGSVPASQTPAGVDAARAFFRGAGAEDLNIPDAELAESMERIGRMVYTLVAGLREILMTRSSIKSEFRINQTMIGAGGNNPLKFALSPEHAVEFLLKPKAKGYLDGNAAVEEALKDIKAHEVAMVTGMEAAIKDVLGRLDPKTLEEKIGGGSGFADLLKGRKSRYWETYEKLYAEISEQAEHDFHEFFSKEFSKAYQKQLERLK